jgi:hypothetical protein
MGHNMDDMEGTRCWFVTSMFDGFDDRFVGAMATGGFGTLNVEFVKCLWSLTGGAHPTYPRPPLQGWLLAWLGLARLQG